MYLERITREEILEKVTEYDIFRHYLGYQFQIGEIFSSPFRRDKNPSFGVYQGKNNLMFKDLATGESGNCFKLASIMLNLRGFELNKQIYLDLNRGRLKTSDYGLKVAKMDIKDKTIISVKRKNFTSTDDEYWSEFHVSRDTLKKYNVSPIEQFWINNIANTKTYSYEEPMYAYKVYNNFQIYRPKSDKCDKFRTNCTEYDLIGLEQLPNNDDLLIVTKSGKDVYVLDELGYNAIAPIGETRLIPEKIVNDLNSRFKRIVLLYDNDEAGIIGSSKIQDKTNWDNIIIPLETKTKDVSDHIKQYGVEKTKDLMIGLLKGD